MPPARERRRDRGRRAPHRLGTRGAAAPRLRADDRRRDRRGGAADRGAAPPRRSRAHAPVGCRVTHRSRSMRRRTLRASLRTRRQDDPAPLPPAGGGPSADRRPLRYLRLDEPIHARSSSTSCMRSAKRRRVHSFLFGTRLTNVTRQLRRKDPDEALAACSDAVLDWSGGTRIATALHEFNRKWSRRVLGQGADRAPLHRRARTGRGRGSRHGDGPAAPLLPAADLAQPAPPLRRLRGQGARHPRHAAPCRRVPADPLARGDGRPLPGASRKAAARADPRRWLDAA